MAAPKGTQKWLQDHVGYQRTDCLPWPFSKTWNGYGQLKFLGKMSKAHRVMCILAHGEPSSPTLVAAHSCNNGHLGCVNPRHLVWKTPGANLMDRRAAGTLTTKRWNKFGLLSDDDVAMIELLKDYANQREIAVLFGISYQHVSVVQNGKLVKQREARKR